jgi:hypothetical protein
MRQAAGGDAEGSGGGTMRNTVASGSHTVEIGAGSGQSETQNPGLRAAEAKGAEAVRSPNHRHSHVKPASSRGVPSNDILQQQVTTDDGHLVLPRHHILQQTEQAERASLVAEGPAVEAVRRQAEAEAGDRRAQETTLSAAASEGHSGTVTAEWVRRDAERRFALLQLRADVPDTEKDEMMRMIRGPCNLSGIGWRALGCLHQWDRIEPGEMVRYTAINCQAACALGQLLKGNMTEKVLCGLLLHLLRRLGPDLLPEPLRSALLACAPADPLSVLRGGGKFCKCIQSVRSRRSSYASAERTHVCVCVLVPSLLEEQLTEQYKKLPEQQAFLCASTAVEHLHEDFIPRPNMTAEAAAVKQGGFDSIRDATAGGQTDNERQLTRAEEVGWDISLAAYIWLAYAHPCCCSRQPTAGGLDRMDPTQAHTACNVAPTSWVANRPKGAWGDWRDFLAFCNGVRKHSHPLPTPTSLSLKYISSL